jgi:Transcriptional regulatory protein, C terminal
MHGPLRPRFILSVPGVGWVLSRDQLRYAVAGRGAEPYDHSVDMLVARLRHKIEPDPKAPRFIQARRRKHPSLAPAPQRPIYVEQEYARTGACAYLAAWDVHRARLFGRCERNARRALLLLIASSRRS